MPMGIPSRPALTGVLLSLALLGQQAAAAQPLSPTLLQRIRQLIGLNRSIAAGGSRSLSPLRVCVITPRSELDDSGQATAQVPLPRPTILTAGPLNEVRIDRDGQPIWSRRASSAAAIEGPIRWPVEPIRPGERLTLLLRPRGASGGDFARVELRGASADELRSGAALESRLGGDGRAWRRAIDTALERQQLPLALALLFSPRNQASGELAALRRELMQAGCRLAEADAPAAPSGITPRPPERSTFVRGDHPHTYPRP